MPRAPKTLLDEANQILRAGVAADNRLWRRNHNIEDLYRDYYSSHDTPMRGPSTLYWQNKRDNAMNAYLEAARLNDRLDARRKKIDKAMAKAESHKETLRCRLESTIDDLNELRLNKASIDPEEYKHETKWLKAQLHDIEESLKSMETLPAGWRGY